ncbi:UNVERIFIED_CONTAM: hypothetical protein GTU68_062305 [Idotea baltica]|nr:hypothetical protein [Idotea baltica]
MRWTLYLEVLKKYILFTGRSHREEFWTFFLVNIIISAIISTLGYLLGDHNGFATLIYNLMVFIPSIGVSVRRLHDTNHSGWWLLISLIPVVGTIVLLIFFLKKSDPTENSFGAISTL